MLKTLKDVKETEDGNLNLILSSGGEITMEQYYRMYKNWQKCMQTKRSRSQNKNLITPTGPTKNINSVTATPIIQDKTFLKTTVQTVSKGRMFCLCDLFLLSDNTSCTFFVRGTNNHLQR
jgi:hypothetical protein